MEYKLVKMAAVSALLLAIAGCSSSVDNSSVSTTSAQASATSGENDEQVAEAEASDVICYQEKKIGSNRKFLRCMNKADREKMAEASRDAWLRSQKGSETGGGDI